MIIRNGQARLEQDEERAAQCGPYASAPISETGGLTQFGAHVMTLQPGSRSSNRHWHEREDEFLYVLAGEVTVVENDGEHRLVPGDAACWPAGEPNAHQVVNRSSAPCSFLIAGTKVSEDVVRYPDLQRTLHVGDGRWRLVDDRDGRVIREGRE